MKVAILHGEVSETARQDEQDVLEQIKIVSRVLSQLGHTPVAMPLSLDLEKAALALQRLRPAYVFNLVESVQGRGHYIHLGPTLLEGLGIPYTGATTVAMLITSNKLLMKKALVASGLPTPDWVAAAAAGQGDMPFAGPYIVKSVWEHGSIGLDDDGVINSRKKLMAYLRHRDQDAAAPWFVERYIPGREFNLSLLAGPDGPKHLPPAEIEFVAYPAHKAKIVGYRAKWDADSFEYQHTCRRFAFPLADAPLLNNLEALALACWHLFDLRGYARVDMRVDANGRAWIVDVNVNPCLAPDGGFVAATEQAGLPLSVVVRRIIAASYPSVPFPIGPLPDRTPKHMMAR